MLYWCHILRCAVAPTFYIAAFSYGPEFTKSQIKTSIDLRNSVNDNNDWGIGDDWSMLSNQEQGRTSSHQNEMFDESFFYEGVGYEPNPLNEISDFAAPDEHIDDVIDSIFSLAYMDSSVPLYDTASDYDAYVKSDRYVDDGSKEISMLIRCNEEPEQLHVDSGRALQKPTNENMYNENFLIDKNSGNPTQFFHDAVQQMFDTHSKVIDKSLGIPVLDASGIAAWLAQSLSNNKVSKFDSRVLFILTKYSTYGSGFLSIENFQCLYLDALMNNKLNKRPASNSPSISDIWRDFRAHGILSPIETEYLAFQQKVDEEIQSSGNSQMLPNKDNSFYDECEILDWGYKANDENGRKRRSSHENVKLSKIDNKTPLHVKDGDFIFIDEESCIGCTQCVQVAPSSFVMEDSGRARAFEQSNSRSVKTAVELCPVDCMHSVSFNELKIFEEARDAGDGRSDHRHMKGGSQHQFTPLHVARRGSDANHKSSWYHYLKQKCHMTQSCPQKGCYDCPHYNKRGENPHFKKLSEEADKVRLRDYIESGAADVYRKFAYL